MRACVRVCVCARARFWVWHATLSQQRCVRINAQNHPQTMITDKQCPRLLGTCGAVDIRSVLAESGAATIAEKRALVERGADGEAFAVVHPEAVGVGAVVARVRGLAHLRRRASVKDDAILTGLRRSIGVKEAAGGSGAGLHPRAAVLVGAVGAGGPGPAAGAGGRAGGTGRAGPSAAVHRVAPVAGGLRVAVRAARLGMMGVKLASRVCPVASSAFAVAAIVDTVAIRATLVAVVAPLAFPLPFVPGAPLHVIAFLAGVGVVAAGTAVFVLALVVLPFAIAVEKARKIVFGTASPAFHAHGNGHDKNRGHNKGGGNFHLHLWTEEKNMIWFIH